MKRFSLACCMLLLLAGCDTFNDIYSYLGGDDDKTPLPGKRISVLSDLEHLKADDTLADTQVTVPDAQTNDAWPQAGGGPAGITGNLALTGYAHHDSAKIGDHNGWEQPLYPSPIVADGAVYAMDAKGYITAHDTHDIGKILWTSKSAVTEDESNLLGGGLAFDSGRIYATSGRGTIFAFDAKTGKDLWKQAIGVSLRTAPKALGPRVYAMSVDNQLFAFDSEKGTLAWSHQGINESAGFLASATPAVTNTIVMAPYTSGVLHAIDTVSGQDVWNDTLILSRRNSATGVFSGIGGNPIIKDDVVYGGGSSGFFAALALLSGRRMWEQNVSTLNSAWIAGDFIYALSSENDLVCLLRADGRVKWVKTLPSYGNEKKHRDPLVWRGPVLANGQLLVVGTHGKMMVFSPRDGSEVTTVDIPENISDAPVVAGGRLYFLTQDAKLHVMY